MSYLRLYSAVPLQTAMEMKSFSVKDLWERSPSELQSILITGDLSYLMFCFSSNAASPLKEPHLA